jgi:hypothetical protein
MTRLRPERKTRPGKISFAWQLREPAPHQKRDEEDGSLSAVASPQSSGGGGDGTDDTSGVSRTRGGPSTEFRYKLFEVI